MNAMTGNNQKLDKKTSDKVSFISFIIPEFAAAFKMKISDAYKYLKKYGGLDFLHKHWWPCIPTTNIIHCSIYTKFALKTEVKDETLSWKLYNGKRN